MIAGGVLPRISASSPATIGIMVGLVVVAGAALVLWQKGVLGTGAAVGKAAGDAAAGVVLGIGDSLGIPRTSDDQCTQDLVAGRTWDASFSCPASRFLGSLFRGNNAQPQSSSSVSPAPLDQTRTGGGASGTW